MSIPPPPPPPPGFDVKRNNSQILNSMNSNTLLYVLCKQIQIDVLVQERRNSSALALELRLIHRNVVLAVIVVALRAQLHLSRANCVSRKRRGITAEDEAHIPVTAKMHLDWSRACKNQPVVWLVRPICRQNTLLATRLCAIIWVQEPIRATQSRAIASRHVASRIVWTVLLISLEPNHAT